MDDDLRSYLEGMEARLLRRINDGNEDVLSRLNSLEGEVRNLRSEHEVTRTMVTALPATVLGAMSVHY
jgi:hypothetical protein